MVIQDQVLSTWTGKHHIFCDEVTVKHIFDQQQQISDNILAPAIAHAQMMPGIDAVSLKKNNTVGYFI